MRRENWRKWSEVLLMMNALLWLGVAIYSFHWSEGVTGYPEVKLLLFAEASLYGLCWWGVRRKLKPVYWLAVGLSLVNTVLSVTDQLDISDVVSLLLSGVTFGVLVSGWQRFGTDTQERITS